MTKYKCNCNIETAICENCKKEWDIEELTINHGFYYCPICLPEIERFWEEN